MIRYSAAKTWIVRRPKRFASEQLGTQISSLLPLIPPPVSETKYVPLHGPALIVTFEPSLKTLGSAAMIPRRTPWPIAVFPPRQYAVALKDPRLAPAPVLRTEAVVLTNFLSSSC